MDKRTIILVCTTLLLLCPVHAQKSKALSVPPKPVSRISIAISPAELKDSEIEWQTEMPWENYLIPAPTAIFLLAQLTVLSGKVDFPLTSLQKNGARFVRHPESFRATLVQVSNDGWTAFHIAHRNMDSIQLYTQQIPRNVQNALRIISAAPPSMMQKLLRIQLKGITDYGKRCADLARNTETKFVDVINLMAEILEGAVSSKGEYDQKLLEAQMQANISRIENANLEIMNAKFKEYQLEINNEVRKHEERYGKAMDEIPTGFKEFFLKMGNALVNVAENVGNSIFGEMIGKKSQGGTSDNSQAGPLKTVVANFARENAMSVGERFSAAMGKVGKTISSFLMSKNATNPAEEFLSFGTVVNVLEKLLGETEDSAAVKLKAMLRKAKTLSENLGELTSVSAKNISSSVKQEVQEKVGSLLEDAKVFEAAAASNGKLPETQNQPSSALGQGAFSGISGNARYKAYVSLEMLKDARRRQQETFQESMKLMREMNALAARIASLDMQVINYKDIVELIKEGIIILGKVREQWHILTEFFATIAVKAELALDVAIQPFGVTADTAIQDIQQFTSDERQFLLSFLADMAKGIYKSSYFLNAVSRMYISVSSRYLLKPLATMASLAVLPAAQRETKLRELEQQSLGAQEEIRQNVRKKQEEYQNTLDAKVAAAQQTLLQLGGPTQSDVKALESASDESWYNKPLAGEESQ